MSKNVALYNKYRPKAWCDVVEQDAVKQILSNELQTGKIKRVLLFTGGAGTGKTTSARIYANEIEPNASNVIEINCADHTGVDDVRSLVIEASRSKPLSGKYKVFVLDECHMLTVQSQNALLKILEEPPSHCIYILCTTDPQKVLGTIMSRAFRYDFQLISHQGIVDRLNYILEQEKLDPDGCGIESWNQDALHMIATIAAGHMRNGIATLDKLVSFTKNITVKDVEKISGASDYGMLFDILDCLLSKQQMELLNKINEVSTSGMDLKLFIKNFLSFVLDINKYVILKTEAPNIDPLIMIMIPSTYNNRLVMYNASHKAQLKSILRLLIELNSSIRWETNVKPVLETNLLLEVL